MRVVDPLHKKVLWDRTKQTNPSGVGMFHMLTHTQYHPDYPRKHTLPYISFPLPALNITESPATAYPPNPPSLATHYSHPTQPQSPARRSIPSSVPPPAIHPPDPTAV